MTATSNRHYYLNSNDFLPPYRQMAEWHEKVITSLLNKNRFHHHVTASVVTIALGVAALASTALGVIAAIFALVSFGYFKSLNTFAFNQLGGVGFAINYLQNGLIAIFTTRVHLALQTQ